MKFGSFLMVLTETIISFTLAISDREQTGTLTRTLDNAVVLLTDEGRTEELHMLAPDAKVLLDGQPCLLSDLEAGQVVAVTFNSIWSTDKVAEVIARSDEGPNGT